MRPEFRETPESCPHSSSRKDRQTGFMNRKAARYRIGVDVGGTFTDAVAYDMANGSLRWAKAPSTPSEPALGVLDAVSALAGDLGAVERFVHGITIGTNAIIERKGADVWVVTTKGFRDTLEIQRTERRELYNIRTLKPPSFVPRPQVLEADERMRYDASVLRALDPAESERIAKTLGSAGAESVAVCFLHSFANDAHERAMRESLVAASPGAYVCTSSEVLPELREYERFSTTVLNAYIGPLMSRYLQALESHLASRGFARTIFLMTSNGGVVSAERARRLPVQTVLSGPAGGVAASIELGRRIDVENLITYDMGGTSTDVCLVEGLRAPLTTEQMIAGYPNRTPQVEIVTIGAGGGSIAWLDGGETLAVGPRSAGADPGPAAYGRGGTDPTVTDANLVLGRLGSETKLASTLALDGTLARASLDRLAAAFGGIETHVLADGVIRIAVARMVSAIKEISIAKGYDPRDFVLLAYGGGRTDARRAGCLGAGYRPRSHSSQSGQLLRVRLPRVRSPDHPHPHLAGRDPTGRVADRRRRARRSGARRRCRARTRRRRNLGNRLPARARDALRRPVVGAGGTHRPRRRLLAGRGDCVPRRARETLRPRHGCPGRNRHGQGDGYRTDRETRSTQPGARRNRRRRPDAAGLHQRNMVRHRGPRSHCALGWRRGRGARTRRGDGLRHRGPSRLASRGRCDWRVSSATRARRRVDGMNGSEAVPKSAATRPAPGSDAVSQTAVLALSVPNAHGMSMLDMEVPMATNVHLTPELASFARACVEGGDYNNVSEVVRSGLRLLKEQEDRRRAFDAMIARSLEEADDKGARTMDDVLTRADAAIEAAER